MKETPITLPVSTEPVQGPIKQLNNTNICAPITLENYGVKIEYDEGGIKKEWHMTLLPAMASHFADGWQVPNAGPGLNIRVKQDIVKDKLLGGGSVYQNLGSNEIEIMMVGMFTGDGGIHRIQNSEGNWGDPIAKYEIQNVGNKFYGKKTINPQTNPPYNTGNRFVAEQLGIKNPDAFFKGSAPELGNYPEYLRDQFGETLFVRKEVTRRGMFDRVGCPVECEPTYRPGISGDFVWSDKFRQEDLNSVPDYTYTLRELDSINDSYLEAVSFYQMAVKSARTLDVEINLRKVRGVIPTIPKDAFDQDYESPIRNGISNVSFKGMVKDLELYVSRSNRVFYTLTMHVVQLEDKKGCSEGKDSIASQIKEQVKKQLEEEYLAAQLTQSDKQKEATLKECPKDKRYLDYLSMLARNNQRGNYTDFAFLSLTDIKDTPGLLYKNVDVWAPLTQLNTPVFISFNPCFESEINKVILDLKSKIDQFSIKDKVFIKAYANTESTRLRLELSKGNWKNVTEREINTLVSEINKYGSFVVLRQNNNVYAHYLGSKTVNSTDNLTPVSFAGADSCIEALALLAQELSRVGFQTELNKDSLRYNLVLGAQSQEEQMNFLIENGLVETSQDSSYYEEVMRDISPSLLENPNTSNIAQSVGIEDFSIPIRSGFSGASKSINNILVTPTGQLYTFLDTPPTQILGSASLEEVKIVLNQIFEGLSMGKLPIYEDITVYLRRLSLIKDINGRPAIEVIESVLQGRLNLSPKMLNLIKYLTENNTMAKIINPSSYLSYEQQILNISDDLPISELKVVLNNTFKKLGAAQLPVHRSIDEFLLQARLLRNTQSTAYYNAFMKSMHASFFGKQVLQASGLFAVKLTGPIVKVLRVTKSGLRFLGSNTVAGNVAVDILLQLIFPESTNQDISPNAETLFRFQEETGCKLSFSGIVDNWQTISIKE